MNPKRLRALLFYSILTVSTVHSETYFHHTFKELQLNESFYCEGASFADLNKDGIQDIISGPFWYQGPDFEQQHEYYPAKEIDPKVYSDHFFSFAYDFNQDSWMDILVIGFPGKDASWYENPKGEEKHWTRHRVMERVDNESPTWIDLTGDGIPEIVCSVDRRFGYASPNLSNPSAPWVFHTISGKETTGTNFTHGLGVGDIDGDGRPDLLERSGWWQQPEDLEGDPTWKKHTFAFSKAGGSQMHTYDIDGDGDQDVITSLAAHGFGLAWYEQTKTEGEITFKSHVIMGSKSEDNPYGLVFDQLHAVALTDMDGDGLKDIVTGQRYWAHGKKDFGTLIYWFKLNRTPSGVEYIPYRISDLSGIGTQLVTGDVNQDGLPDLVVGNKKGTFLYTHSKAAVNQGEWPMHQPRRVNVGGASAQNEADGMTVPDGFQVNLIAAEPMVKQPIAMTIDDRGRIWIAEAYAYPRRKIDGEGQDRIIILEDQDHDGEFETQKVFIDNLSLVSGLEVGFGGVWVGAAPYLMFIPDRDGDDRPDSKPQVLLDGWGFHDTHETLNAFIWGPDGWLYGCHGVFTHSRVGKPGTRDADRIPMNAGVWRYHPTRHQFEVFAWGTSNPWGVDFNDEGHTFLTACVISHLYHMVQGGRYIRQGGRHFNPYVFTEINTIADHLHYTGNIRDSAHWGHRPTLSKNVSDAGGGHAHSGLSIYLGDNFPDEYRGRLLFNNIHGHRVNTDLVERSGSGYIGSHGQDFLFANDEWYMGVNMRYGPDGGLYLFDWYDKQSCHRNNPLLWDRSNGRVFHITYGSPEPVSVNLSQLSDRELVELQLHRNDWYVRTARRVLQERAAKDQLANDTHPLLKDIISDNPDHTRILRAMWALHVTGGFTESLGRSLLTHKNEYVRSWSVQLLSESGTPSSETVKHFVKAAEEDTSPLMRLYLSSAMQRLAPENRWALAENLIRHSEDQDDQNLPALNWYGIEPLVTQDLDRAMKLAELSEIPEITRFITRRAAAEPKGLESVIASAGRSTVPSKTLLILDEIINALRNQADLSMPDSWTNAYETLMKNSDEKIRNQAEYLAVRFGDHRIFPSLRKVLADRSGDSSERTRAYEILMNGNDEASAPILQELLSDSTFAEKAITGLAKFSHPETSDRIIRSYSDFSPTLKRTAIGTLVSRPSYAAYLLKAIEKNNIPGNDLTAIHVRQILQFNQKDLTDKLNRVWGSIRNTSQDSIKLKQEYKGFLTAENLAKADRSYGRAIFNKTCAACHTLFGEGAEIGPDLTGSNRSDLDYILDNILDPSAVLGKDYEMTSIETKDGRFLSGIIDQQNESAVTLKTLTETVVVPRSAIDSIDTSPISMMPEGLLSTFQPDEIRDLIAYLAHSEQVPLPGAAPELNTSTGRVPGALEGESLKVISSRGSVSNQLMSGFSKSKWSGNDQLWWNGGKPGDRIELNTPVGREGHYAVFISLTKARDYGIFRITLNGKAISKNIDLFNEPDVITTGVIFLGEHHLKAGDHVLGVELIGANPKAVQSYMFGLDWIKFSLVPKS